MLKWCTELNRAGLHRITHVKHTCISTHRCRVLMVIFQVNLGQPVAHWVFLLHLLQGRLSNLLKQAQTLRILAATKSSLDDLFVLFHKKGKAKGKGSSLDIAPLTILNSGTLQPRKWQLTGIDCSTAAQGQWQPRDRANRLLGPQLQPAGIQRPSQPR